MSNPLALIVEDDPDISDIFAQALEAARFETEIVRDDNKALTRLATLQPAVVVLDLHLPHVSGETILRQIRADTRLSKTRVILASADPGLAEMCRPQADLVLIKPISFTQLRDLAIRLRPRD